MPDIQATYIEVSAEVRYWEDSKINGVEDENGTLTPFRSGDLWCPVIRLEDGTVMDWPAGMVADFHFKVCDAGQYWLLDDSRSPAGPDHPYPLAPNHQQHRVDVARREAERDVQAVYDPRFRCEGRADQEESDGAS